MKKIITVIIAVLTIWGIIPTAIIASGISVDAGLTPPEGRWITRAQIRYMPSAADNSMGNSEMTMYGLPIMVAYGARNYLMIMARQTVMSKDMTMMGMNSSHTGPGDLFLLGKYKAYRLNTPGYTIGVSPTLGISIPTGDDNFTSDSWDLNTGLYISGRRARFSAHLNLGFNWYDFTGDSDKIAQPGNEISLDWAGTYQIGFARDRSFAPVVELSYNKALQGEIDGADDPNSGGDILYVSPGAKLTISSTIFEALLRIPASQNPNGAQMEAETGFIAGMRVMF
ncbi:MAG: transporter [candidate division Zixibacteria bacterium]